MGELIRIFLSGPFNVYSCRNCQFHLARKSDTISMNFQGQSGPAYLFETVYNVGIDEMEQDRQMTTGRHLVKTIRCIGCGSPVGWTYLRAFSPDQKYKEGKYIIERACMTEEDNAAVKVPDCLKKSHDLITALNYFHQL